MIAPELQGRLSAQDISAVKALVDEVHAFDSTPPLSDHVMLHLPHGGDADVRHLLVRAGSELLGYAHLEADPVAGSSAELAVLPSARGRGIGRALVESLLQQAPDGRLRLWAHGENPAAAKLAASMGFQELRVLWQMRRSLADPLPPARLPEGVTLRSFVVGQDEQAWTALNNRAFADHPDQGGWGVEEVQVREQEPWFDPAGFFLACRGEQLVGFHWTKVHGSQGQHGHDPFGEVYVVGVDPAEQGKGLGPALTLVGLEHLRASGLAEVMLYVDESNTAAVRVYEGLGFARSSTDVCFGRQVSAGD